MLVNNYESLKYDTLKEKARGVIVDELNRICIVKIGECFTLPGGSVEHNESKEVAVKRELCEEIGLVTENITYLTSFMHFHKNYLYLKEGGEGNRININHYFFKKINSSELTDNNPTDFEKNNNIQIFFYTYDEIIELTSAAKTDFEYALNEEIKTIIEYCKKQKLV